LIKVADWFRIICTEYDLLTDTIYFTAKYVRSALKVSFDLATAFTSDKLVLLQFVAGAENYFVIIIFCSPEFLVNVSSTETMRRNASFRRISSCPFIITNL
jgi:hypothetical protein